jgi:hypothetical protein
MNRRVLRCASFQKNKKALPLYKNIRAVLFLFCKKKKGSIFMTRGAFESYKLSNAALQVQLRLQLATTAQM